MQDAKGSNARLEALKILKKELKTTSFFSRALTVLPADGVSISHKTFKKGGK
jgi:hypothetical protein